MTTFVHDFEVHDKHGFEQELDKIVRKYKPTVDIIWAEPIKYKAEVQIGPDRVIRTTFTKHPVTVKFDFDQYKVNGFTYLGCIQDEMMMGLITVHGNDLVDENDGTEIVSFISQFEDIPCHNCGRKHRRKYGHVFRVDDTGELVIFGSACAKNYFGIDFDRLLRFFERIKIFTGGEWEEDYVGQMRSKLINWQYVALLSYYEILKHGYLSGTKAREQERPSTADIAREMYNDNHHVMTKQVQDKIHEMRTKGEFPDFNEMAEKDFLNGKTEDLNDFEHNLMILQEKMKLNAVTFKSFGWIAFLVYKAYFHVEEKKPAKKEYIIPDWAEKGRRFKKGEMEAQCTVAHMHTFAGTFGLTTIYTLEWNDIRFKWFATTDQNVEIGDEVVLNGFTVKGTEDNQYGKAVIINRARLEDPETGKPTNGRERAKVVRKTQDEVRLGM